jgi:hypothetical protein
MLEQGGAAFSALGVLGSLEIRALMTVSSSPGKVVGLLRQGDPSGRALLAGLCREPIGRLIDRLFAGDQRAYDRTLLVDRTLRWVEMYLRSRDAREFTEMTREKFLAQLLAAAYKLLTPVSSGKSPALHQSETQAMGTGRPLANTDPPPGSRPTREINSSLFIVQTHARPLERVGGDWVGLKLEDDGSLWIFMADVTGHGSPAHIIANGLPYLWETRSIAQCRADGRAPGEVLAALGTVLETVLPETVFVEAILVRFSPAGRARASGAGNCRLLLRRSGLERFDFHRLGGSWLGLGLHVHDHGEWELAGGDECLLASDGLYEQRDGEGCHLERTLDARAGVHLTSGRSLHDAVIATLDEVLAGARQNDDILVVTVRLRTTSPPDLGTGHAGM